MKRTNLSLLFFLIGFVLVVLPNNDAHPFSLREEYGPSLTDSIGILLILCAELILTGKIWRQRVRVAQTLGATGLVTSTFLFSLGLALVIAAVTNSAGYWWVPGIGLMVLVQVRVFYIALK